MKFSVAAIAVSSLFVLQAAAHGYVDSVKIDGKTYKGMDPTSGKKFDSAIRRISTQDPNYGATKSHITCGPGAQNAALVATANPGSSVDIVWKTGQGGRWPHNTGPSLTYLASCGSTSCDKFNAADAKWFKIHEGGKKSNGQWLQQDIMNGAPVSFTLPSNLAPGNYLLRHEIIALHLAPKAEFYPSCTQIKVGGNKNGVPKASELVSFPGAYKDSDPGITGKGIYSGRASDYQMPGPKIASLVAGSGNVEEPASTPATAKDAATTKAAQATTQKAPAATTTPKSTVKTCRQKKREAAPEPEAAPSPEQLYSEAYARAESEAARRDVGTTFVRRHSKFVRMAKRSH
ncbi:hypothetical protein BDN71DRAFT_1481963 [Pleurotus eryngii]|uniref:AA9 family lytic polysaccharide monooxygenase n=1 Tax=Pleurotus eryngii TaxID=5323 RepID=A0A9P6DH74_PLEER|nr:hypothetical protein BDN71DRAFT_1481963 [Pleurotus eryngii]